MRVSRRSWHYRWWFWLHDCPANPPQNLCRYFWGIALPTAVIAGLLLGILSVLVLGIYWTFVRNTVETLLVLGVSAALALLFWAGYRAIKWLEERPKSAAKSKKPPKEPGLVRSYLRAKKQKVCPLIEVVDG